MIACAVEQDLTDNVNVMAANLTTQVRTIAVATVRRLNTTSVYVGPLTAKS